MRNEIRVIPSGGLKISARIVGDGPLVILMHGFPELGFSWRHQIPALATAGFTVAAPDMRGYGASSKPQDVSAYGVNALADDMRAVADTLGHDKWVSIGHDWGAPVAWRTALRFPERVAAVFCLSVPYQPPAPIRTMAAIEMFYPNLFHYVRYFQQIGPAEAELQRDVRAALKQMYYVSSGDAPKDELIKPRPIDSALLDGLEKAPPGPLSFMSDAELDQYARAYEAGGFFGAISWYRNMDADFDEMQAYADPYIRQPAGFLCGEKEIVLSMVPGGLETQRTYVPDLRVETILPGAGHWIQQERPSQVTAILLDFLNEIRPRLSVPHS